MTNLFYFKMIFGLGIGIAFLVLGRIDHYNSKIITPYTTHTQTGEHDFDFEIGTWKTHLRRLKQPLTDSSAWADYEGTTIVRKVWNGRANLVELVADGPAGHPEALSLRLYNPQSGQWSLNFANSNNGALSQPTFGGFKNGHGEFYDQEIVNGRAIFVRFIISNVTPVHATLSSLFRMMAEKPGKLTGWQPIPG